MNSTRTPCVSVTGHTRVSRDSDKAPLITESPAADDTQSTNQPISDSDATDLCHVVNNNDKSRDPRARVQCDLPRFADDDLKSLEDEILNNYLADASECQKGGGGITCGIASDTVSTGHRSGSPTPDCTTFRFRPIADINDVLFTDCQTHDGITPCTPEDKKQVSVDFFRAATVTERSLDSKTVIYNSIPQFSPLAAMRMNLSFAGCGFLGIYHLGVAHALVHHGHKLLMNVQKFGGASAGSLVAAALAVRGPDKLVIQRCIDFCYSMADDVQHRRLGVLTPGLSLLDPLQSFLLEMFPDDAHVVARDRLYVSVTEARTRKNILRSEFDSREQLIKYLLGSSYVPRITGTKPVKIDGKKYIDGGITDNLPELPGGRTICVTPFCGRQDIGPVDKHGRGWFIHIQGEDFQVNRANIRRGLHAFFPPKRKYLDRYLQRGKEDAVRFLKKENFYSEAS